MDVEIPGYEIIKEIARGGMATVYIAIQKNFDRQVALKIMAPRLTADPQFGVRFLREARIVASLNHRNIVPVFDVGHHGDFHYLAMEYLPGGDLKTRLRAGLSPDNALYAIYEIANALAYAHSKSIIHRDIKPENVLFREDSTLVLTDFGIAKAMDSTDHSLTSTGVIVGSPQYMSPEQALAKNLDTRTDIYSLGVVFYESLVGRPLYDAGSSVAAAISHISNPIPQLPPQYACLQPILEKMVAKQPEDRFQTMAELELALEPLLRVSSDVWHTVAMTGQETDQDAGQVTHVLLRPGVISRSGQFTAPRRDTPLPHVSPESLTVFDDGSDPTLRIDGQPGAGNNAAAEKPARRWRSAKGGAVAAVAVLAGSALLWGVASQPGDPASIPPASADSADIQEIRQLSVATAPLLVDEAEPDTAEAKSSRSPQPPANSQSSSVTPSDMPILASLTLPKSQTSPEKLAEPAMPEARTLTADEQAQIDEHMTQATDALARERLMYPKGTSAYDHYSAVLAIQPDHAGALTGMEGIVARYRVLASQQLNAGKLSTAREYVGRGETIAQNYNLAAQEQAELAKLRLAVDRVHYLDTISHIEKWNRTLEDSDALTVANLNEAYRYYMVAVEEGIEEPRVTQARKRYSEAFYELGKRFFKDENMETSHELIAKGLAINPRHEELQALDARWQRKRDGKETFFERLW